ncbi:type II toxin-antitoxin system Phd/YefM family antitoxin [Natronogracilivirga saccharolytica]|uniref:Antitoxin n=1 Tax=Natronogracilivirga saccharolytica TaxID=2812953 RepID=A0A8J7S9S9_9BACT|nr:type II toxin-antitoxin system Phd/YefM family antitoxin [Natronogracilivirga saccharolytica]MBP3192716.1 type II toxin-antitoxin system Phd/YefM family antitoxin [Natronogracilivirga saccharolytica]
MKRIHLDKDIQPLSAFRANAASIIQKVKKDHRPVVITQHGKGSAILLDVTDYEEMVDTIEMLLEVNQARRELDQGKGVPHQSAMKSVRERLKQLK